MRKSRQIEVICLLFYHINENVHIRKEEKQMLGLRKRLNDVDRMVYENEMKRLEEECDKYMRLYKTADKYKAEYKQLVDDYKRKNMEIDKLKRVTEELNEVLRNTIDTLNVG